MIRTCFGNPIGCLDESGKDTKETGAPVTDMVQKEGEDMVPQYFTFREQKAAKKPAILEFIGQKVFLEFEDGRRIAWSADSSSAITVESPNATDNQHWIITPAGSSYRLCTPTDGHTVMDVDNFSKLDQAPIIKYAYRGASNQKFNVVENGEGESLSFTFVNEHSGLALSPSSDPAAKNILVQSIKTESSNSNIRVLLTTEIRRDD